MIEPGGGGFNNGFVMAAAHSLTPRAARTWYAYMPRTPRVLVPVHLEVLMVRQAGGAWARCGMDAPSKDSDDPKEIEKILPPPFQNLAASRPKGAYLHWALPDALTRASQERTKNPDGTETGKTEIPAIPDRWLVMRIYPSPRTPNRRSIQGWVLRAHDPNPVPVTLDSWIETGAPPPGVKKPLTALGHGDTAWSGYYDNVVNRMAFYDSLSGVENGPLAYVVCGWHFDESQDPLGDDAIRSLTDFENKLNELRWSVPDKDLQKAAKTANDRIYTAQKAGLPVKFSPATARKYTAAFQERPLKMKTPGSTPQGPPYQTDGTWWPNHTLYHGSVVAIGWPGIGWKGNEQGVLSGEEGGPPPPASVQVATGNTLAEGLASLVARQNATVKERRVLEAFQLGLLSALNEPDGRARIDTGLHAATFGSLPGGEVTERVLRPPSGTPPEPRTRATKVERGVFSRYENTSRTKSSKTFQKYQAGEQLMSSQVESKVFQSKSIARESKVEKGRLDLVMNRVAAQSPERYTPARWEDVRRALPRFFHPGDPVFLVQGVKRSFQFGLDGRFTKDGTLQCRLTGTCIKEYVQWHGDISYPPITADDILDRGVENGSVPPECDEILGEVAMLDPGSSVPVVHSATKSKPLTESQFTSETRRVMVEQTAWWATRDPRVDHGPLVSRSSFEGVLPSPVAVTPPSQPWSPVHLEWRVEYIPSPGGKEDWTLGEADYNEIVPKLPPSQGASGVIQMEGRSTLTLGANRTLAQAVRGAIEQISTSGGSGKLPSDKQVNKAVSPWAEFLIGAISEMTVKGGPTAAEMDRSALEDIATALESMDVLSGGLNGLHTRLRGGLAGDGETKQPDGEPIPSPFHLVRSGFLRILRLRMVDAFGQFVDLAGSGPNSAATPSKIVRSEPLEVTGRPELLALPPRFTSPARLMLRYMDANGLEQEASLPTDTTAAVSPVCGYLMPNHVDDALLFYSADGSDLGVVRHGEDGRVLWEDAPGRPSTVGQSPLLAVPNPFLARTAQALLEWGVADAGLLAGPDTALQALMRVIDSTLWSVDPYGHQGEEHLALLLGHPVVVMRAVMRLEVKEPVDPANVNLVKIPVRIGSLAQWQDGVFAFFVNDDYKRLYCAPAAAKLAREVGPARGFLQQAGTVQNYYANFGNDIDAQANAGSTPVEHPYVDTTGLVYVQPGQDVRLTILVEPFTYVHATSGALPRKEIGMRREWVKQALARLSPTFRFGPVLIDPKRIKMPIPHDLQGAWSWDHRIDVTRWANDPVVHATHDATLSDDPLVGSEGWLRLTPPDEEQGGN